MDWTILGFIETGFNDLILLCPWWWWWWWWWWTGDGIRMDLRKSGRKAWIGFS